MARNATREQAEMIDEPVNCLRNERVEVRFIPRSTELVRDPRHVLYGGMSDMATRSFVVPRLNSTGQFVNVLTNSEKEYLEQAMGLEFNALSVYKRENNFWDDSNPTGIGRVTLRKKGNFLDLSVPEDYIKYKILLANKNYIASSLKELEDRPKATYQFVLVNEEAESKNISNKVDTVHRCWMEYGKIEDNVETMKMVASLMDGRPVGGRISKEYLQTKMDEYIGKDPRRFLSILTDPLLQTKVLINRCFEAGIIGKKNDTYYLKKDGSPLCEMNEESTLNNAAKYISSPKRQELKFGLEAELNRK